MWAVISVEITPFVGAHSVEKTLDQRGLCAKIALILFHYVASWRRETLTMASKKLTRLQMVDIAQGVATAAVREHGYTENGRKRFLQVCRILDSDKTLSVVNKREWNGVIKEFLVNWERRIEQQGVLL